MKQSIIISIYLLEKTMEIKDLREENVWDYENGFYWFSDTTRINKLLYHFELYKMILNVACSPKTDPVVKLV